MQFIRYEPILTITNLFLTLVNHPDPLSKFAACPDLFRFPLPDINQKASLSAVVWKYTMGP